jgi:rubrerythrin
MPDFTNPFSGNVPEKKLTHEELVRAIRLDVAAEQEAIHLYMAHAEATNNPLVKKVLIDIANEERVHIGEFERLLQILTGDEDEWIAEGKAEVDELSAELTKSQQAELDKNIENAESTTIGSLKA